MAKQLPSEWAENGYFVIEGAYNPKRGDFVDFYTRNATKKYGRVASRTKTKITLVDEQLKKHTFTIRHGR